MNFRKLIKLDNKISEAMNRESRILIVLWTLPFRSDSRKAYKQISWSSCFQVMFFNCSFRFSAVVCPVRRDLILSGVRDCMDRGK